MENKNISGHGCERFDHFASYADKYIDGELTEKEINELFEHAEVCPECRRYLEITVKTDEAVDVPEMTPLPRGLHAHNVVGQDGCRRRASQGAKDTARIALCPHRRRIPLYIPRCRVLYVHADEI